MDKVLFLGKRPRFAGVCAAVSPRGQATPDLFTRSCQPVRCLPARATQWVRRQAIGQRRPAARYGDRGLFAHRWFQRCVFCPESPGWQVRTCSGCSTAHLSGTSKPANNVSVRKTHSVGVWQPAKRTNPSFFRSLPVPRMPGPRTPCARAASARTSGLCDGDLRSRVLRRWRPAVAPFGGTIPPQLASGHLLPQGRRVRPPPN